MSLHPGAGYTLLAAFFAAAATARLAKTERRAALTAFGLLLACFGALALAGALRDAGLVVPAGYLRGIALYSEGLCLVYLSGVFLFRALLPILRLNTPHIVQDVVVAVAWMAWTVIWLRANQVDLNHIVATSAVVTAVIAFSLQDTLGNILGGIAIQLDQSIQVGDWIEVDGVVGRVSEIRWRQTSLETRNWETVVIPNGYLVKNQFKVLGRRKGAPVQLRRTIEFEIDYSVPPSEVIEAVEKALRTTQLPRAAREPSPLCLLADFGASAAVYWVRYWLTDLHSDDGGDSDVRQCVYYALQRAGLEPCIPSQAVFVTNETEERRRQRQEEQIARRMEALRRIDLLSTLHEEELRLLAGRLVPSPFAAGEVMTRQGAEADFLYLVVDGWADVMIEAEDGSSARVAELGPGSFFGEMGLLTGEPRSATVIARSRVHAFRLDKEAFQEVLQARPAIAEEVSNILAQRRGELAATRENLDAEARKQFLSSGRAVLNRIRRFFSLD